MGGVGAQVSSISCMSVESSSESSDDEAAHCIYAPSRIQSLLEMLSWRRAIPEKMPFR